MTIMQNALHSFGGDWSWVPPKANTIGPREILGARHRSFWLDGDLRWRRLLAALHRPPGRPRTRVRIRPGVDSADRADRLHDPRRRRRRRRDRDGLVDVVCLGILVADVIARPVDELPHRSCVPHGRDLAPRRRLRAEHGDRTRPVRALRPRRRQGRRGHLRQLRRRTAQRDGASTRARACWEPRQRPPPQPSCWSTERASARFSTCRARTATLRRRGARAGRIFGRPCTARRRRTRHARARRRPDCRGYWQRRSGAASMTSLDTVYDATGRWEQAPAQCLPHLDLLMARALAEAQENLRASMEACETPTAWFRDRGVAEVALKLGPGRVLRRGRRVRGRRTCVPPRGRRSTGTGGR